MKKVISKPLKTTVLFHFYQFVAKYLNDCFVIKCLTFLENDLIFQIQPGFKPESSCISQLLSTNHEILSVLDIDLEVRGLFLDISKAFDKIWHAGLNYELSQNGISGVSINIQNDFLANGKQRVILSGQCSSWVNI